LPSAISAIYETSLIFFRLSIDLETPETRRAEKAFTGLTWSADASTVAQFLLFPI